MADPETIYHWRRRDDRITTSGQPTEPQLEGIQALGIRHIVNLVEGRAGARPLHRELSGFGLLLSVPPGWVWHGRGPSARRHGRGLAPRGRLAAFVNH
jgi:hypothetical protein